MAKRKLIWERMAVAADLSAEPIPKQPLVELAGEHRVIVENHYGVTGYSATEICVKVRFGYIMISGMDLELVQMTKVQLVVMGKIDSVRLCRGER